jgi:hypothetical protein
MAPINKLDDEDTILQKLNTVSSFIDILVVTRAINYKGNSQSFLRYIIYSLVKEVRNKSLIELKEILKEKLYSNKETLESLDKYAYTNGSRKFIHYLFARCILYVERTKYNNSEINMNSLMVARRQNRFVLTPIISDFTKYGEHFKKEEIFNLTEKKIGNYILIPNPISVGFCSDNSPSKISRISKEFNLTKSLASSYYTNLEPNDYLKSIGFSEFKDFKSTIENRTNAMNNLIREIWDIEKI